MTELIALFVLSIAYYCDQTLHINLKLNPIVLSVVALISFSATSCLEPRQTFEQPQYLLFNSEIEDFRNSTFPTQYETYDTSSFWIIYVDHIPIDRAAVLDDEFHKVQILKDLDMRFIKESVSKFETNYMPTDYEGLRDQLTPEGSTVIKLALDSTTDHLQFLGSRLHGKFKRFSNYKEQLLIDGQYKNGIEDSLWSFYTLQGEISSKKYFENGELTTTEIFENSKLKTETKLNTRAKTIRNKYFVVASLATIILGLLLTLYTNFRSSVIEDIINVPQWLRVFGILLLPLLNLLLTRVILWYIFQSDLNPFSQFIEEFIWVYALIAPAYLLVFYFLKLRNKFDIIYYFLLFSLAIALTEEWGHLREIISETSSFAG